MCKTILEVSFGGMTCKFQDMLPGGQSRVLNLWNVTLKHVSFECAHSIILCAQNILEVSFGKMTRKFQKMLPGGQSRVLNI